MEGNSDRLGMSRTGICTSIGMYSYPADRMRGSMLSERILNDSRNLLATLKKKIVLTAEDG